MGRPILLVSPDGEAKDLVALREVGRWVPAGNPEILSTTVRELADDGQAQSRYAEAALTAAPMHSREAQAKQMLAVFDVVRD